MRSLAGYPFNINKCILGKVTTKQVLPFKRRNYIFISTNCHIPSGYAAILMNKLPSEVDLTPIVHIIQDIDHLKDGDIILIEPSGQINVLYEKNTYDNSILVTQRCNCACIMCPQPKLSNEYDQLDLNIKLISLMDKNTKILGITGGEPTLLENSFFEIISACKKYLPKTELNLLTNGINFHNLDFVQKLIKIKHPNLFIEIPIYADTDSQHNKIIGAKGFYKTIQGLYNLALFNQKIGLRIVIHKLNYERLPQLAEFIYHNFPFVFHIAFMQMEIIGHAKENIDELWIDPYYYDNHLETAINYLNNRQMNVSIYNSQLCILPKSLWKFSKKSISSWKNIYIDECTNCNQVNNCGGLFVSSINKYSEYLKTIKFDTEFV
ncbi:MAG: His-Xaa-Ser system radical SAM maturase HxsC [Candidatus Gastranaerophilales bacterium]|nr:His-Xaa-Ser system radical SAM maturase HxsC [Candidatus Gastranaerophilales bacterium]